MNEKKDLLLRAEAEDLLLEAEREQVPLEVEEEDLLNDETYFIEQLLLQVKEQENIIANWEEQSKQWKIQSRYCQELQQELESCRKLLSDYQRSPKIRSISSRTTPGTNSNSLQQLNVQLQILRKDYQELQSKLLILEKNNEILSKNNSDGETELLRLQKKCEELEKDNEELEENCRVLEETLAALQSKLIR